MSYSFNVKAQDKEAAKQAVLEKFNEIVEQQPVHQRDRDAALANACAVIDLLADDDTRDVGVSCNGYVSWGAQGDLAEVPFSSVSIGCQAGHVDRVAA